MGEGMRGIIRPKSNRRPVLGAYVCVLFTSGPKAVSYVLVYLAVNPKSSIRSVLFSVRSLYYSQSMA
jgi:hypothetical protein